MKRLIIAIATIMCLSGASISENYLNPSDSQDWYNLYKSENYDDKIKALLFLQGLNDTLHSFAILNPSLELKLGTHADMLASYLESNPNYYNEHTVNIYLEMCRERKMLWSYDRTISSIDALYSDN